MTMRLEKKRRKKQLEKQLQLKRCNLCGSPVREDRIKRHKAETCAGRLLPCPYCTTHVRRDYTRTHLANCKGAQIALAAARRAQARAERERIDREHRIARGLKNHGWRRSGRMSGTNGRHQCRYVTITHGARY